MNILHSSFNFSPVTVSVSYMENGKVDQVFIPTKLIQEFVKEETLFIEPSDYINALIRKESELLDLVSYVIPKLSIDNVSKIVSENTDNLDIYDVPADLQLFLSQIIKDRKSNEDYIVAWSLFANKLQRNVDPYIRQQLFRFLSFLIEEGSLAITPNGTILGYKGIKEDFHSKKVGTAYVDGTIYENTTIPNNVGSIVSMARSSVTADPNTACSTGLHVGSYKYAKCWAPKLVIVEVDPQDVVSIPIDESSQKMRCSKYKVITEADDMITEKVISVEELIKKFAKEDNIKDEPSIKLTDLSDDDIESLNSGKELKDKTSIKLTDLSDDDIDSLNSGKELKDKTSVKLTDLSDDDIDSLNSGKELKDEAPVKLTDLSDEFIKSINSSDKPVDSSTSINKEDDFLSNLK